MPNWATVTRKVYGSKEDLKTIENAITKCENAKEAIVNNGFGKLWLGCVVTALGGDWNMVGCRGEITSYCMAEDYLQIESMEAWGEQEGFRHFLEQCFTSDDGDCAIDITYYCSEPGMCEYYTNDPDCDAVYMEVWSLDEEGEEADFCTSYEADSTEDALYWIGETFFDDTSDDFDTLEDAEEAMKKAGFRICICEYEYQED